ncbi:MAG: hypothetical protein PHR16_12095 [Methylovulum sp.]|nr:hypothetical protein [Methylovulum sp.]
MSKEQALLLFEWGNWSDDRVGEPERDIKEIGKVASEAKLSKPSQSKLCKTA